MTPLPFKQHILLEKFQKEEIQFFARLFAGMENIYCPFGSSFTMYVICIRADLIVHVRFLSLKGFF